MNVQYFVARGHLIEKIDGYLQKVETVNDRTKIVVLGGMGGKALLNPLTDQS